MIHTNVLDCTENILKCPMLCVCAAADYIRTGNEKKQNTL